MTTETRPDRDFWPTVADEDNPQFRMCVMAHRENLHALVYTLDGIWFYATWTDGVANSWREKYTNLSYALCRIGLLAYCEETDRWALDNEEADFIGRAKPFLQDAVCAEAEGGRHQM